MNFNSYTQPEQIAVYNTRKLYEQEKVIFAKYFSTGKKLKILDIGCGEGRTTINLHEAGQEVVGVDVVPIMINKAKEKYPQIDFRAMDAGNLDFPEASFDVVLFSFNGLDCLYPEAKRWQAVAEIWRVLKPGGFYIMSSHNSVVWPTNKYKMFWWLLNLVTGKIFTPYKLEYKGFRRGIKFIYFSRRPSRQIKDFTKRRFELVETVTKKDRKNKWWLIDLFEEWPYFIFRKK